MSNALILEIMDKPYSASLNINTKRIPLLAKYREL